MSKKLVKRAPKWPKVLFIVAAIISFIAAVSIFFVHRNYLSQLRPVNITGAVEKHVTIPLGSSVGEIADLLKEEGLIRSDWAFEWHVRSREVRDQLQAGTYILSTAHSVNEMVDIITSGRIATDQVTILPGQRIDQIRKDFIKVGFDEADVDAAFDPDQYAGHPALVDKPRAASLEGYIFPETFQKSASTRPEEIIRLSLDELQKRLTPEVRQAFASRGLSVHQALILGSIVEQEAGKLEDKPQVAQVFLKRLKEGMRLESDPTAHYGALLAGVEPSLSFDSPYNTYKRDGLPAGPISNVSESSLQAVANPATTEWLYFVADDDGKTTHFSKTLAEHQELTRKHCKKLCQ